MEVDGVRPKQVREAMYLGVSLSDNGEIESELRRAEHWYGGHYSRSTESTSL